VAVSVRRFLKDVDEPVWVELINAEYRDYVSWWRGTTVEEMLKLEKQAGFDFEGRFIAEIDGKPAGLIHAHVEKSGEEQRGFIRDLCVLPAFRDGLVEARLLESAVQEFRKCGVSRIRAWTGVDRADRIGFLERSGFKFSNRTIDMRINLADIAVDLHENLDVAIRQLKSGVEGDVEALNWLDNECFKADPLHVSHSVEETRQMLLEDPFLGWREVFFAVLDDKDVGYVGVGIDERYNVEHGLKTGYINGFGVLPRYRRRGIGTRLLLHALRRLKDKGMTSASLDTEDTNPTRAITLYEKVGFKVLQEYVTYMKDLVE
jgi:ribosomal protein S18 acetylase RimI-like enzyme